MQAKLQVQASGMQGAASLTPAQEGNLALFLATGTEESFNQVCKWLSPRLLRYFRLRGCENATAEELTQDVLFTVFRHSAGIRDQSLFRGWVYTVARNSLLQRWRKGRRDLDMTGLETIEAKAPAAAVTPLMADTHFTELVACLAPEEREVLTLRFVDELNYREIATALSIPVGTAKWRVFNSKLKLSLHMRKVAR